MAEPGAAPVTEVTPTPAPPPVVPPPVVKVTPAAPPPTQAEPKRHRATAEGDIPEDADLIEMSPRALASRVARATKAQLKERFGTDDPEQIKRDLEEVKTLREEKRKAEEAKLSEIERANKRAQEAESRATAAEVRARAEAEGRIFDQFDSRMNRIASKLIDDDYAEAELNRFAKHLVDTYEEKALEAWDAEKLKAVATEWFGERIKAKPKLARDYEDKKREELLKEIKADAKTGGKSVKVTNGAGKTAEDGGGPPPASGGAKTFAPGKPNSMTDAEVRAEKRKNGWNW